jgi:low affinity Fe/Cu permease
MLHLFSSSLTALGTMSARPYAFLVLLAYASAWLIFEPSTLDFHGVATLCTWAMTLFIQRAEHRDTQGIHAKLDELLHAEGKARNEITKIDDKEPEEIETIRQEERRAD